MIKKQETEYRIHDARLKTQDTGLKRQDSRLKGNSVEPGEVGMNSQRLA